MADELQVLVFKSDNFFIAQCVEIDIAAQGKTEEEAVRNLRTLVRLECKDAKDEGRDVFSIGPAPAEFAGLCDSEIVHRRLMVA